MKPIISPTDFTCPIDSDFRQSLPSHNGVTLTKWPHIRLVTSLFAGFSMSMLLSGCAGTGSGGGGSTESTVLPFRSYFVYTANADSSDISVFRGAQDGTLTFLRKVTSPSAPTKLIVSGSTLYAACDFKLEVFSGAATGNLSLIQTVDTDGKTADYTPHSLAFGYGDTDGNPSALLKPTKLYVLGTGLEIAGSELQTYSIAANGTLSLKAALDQFSGQGAIASLSYASAYGSNIIAVTNLNNTVSIVLDDDKSQTVTANLKLGSAKVAVLSSVQSDIGTHFYVADQLSKTISEIDISNFITPRAQLIKTLSTGTTPAYLGSSIRFPVSGPIYGTPEFYSANSDLNTVSNFNCDQGTNANPGGSPFQQASGAQADAGPGVTAVNGIELPNASGGDAYYVYSTNKTGALQFYTGAKALYHSNTYDTQGTGVSDVAITGLIGPAPTVGTGGSGPFVEYFDGAYLSGSTSISVSDPSQTPQPVDLGALAGPFALAGEKSATVTASTSTGTKITSGTESYSSANRYLVLVAADKFGSAIDTYTYPNNAYPTSANEWIVIFNGIPDFISGMDFYVLGPGKTVQNSTPSASNVQPGVGAFVSIPANLGQFTVVATYAGGKGVTDIISTSATQTSAGATSIVADLADVKDVYSFVFAAEKQGATKAQTSLSTPALKPRTLGAPPRRR